VRERKTVFNRHTPTEFDTPHQLDETIQNLIQDLAGLDANDEGFSVVTDTLTKLIEQRRLDKVAAHERALADKPPAVSPDVAVNAASTITGIILIIGYERLGIITTKALGFIPKLVR
jgi:hypothetical protein